MSLGILVPPVLPPANSGPSIDGGVHLGPSRVEPALAASGTGVNPEFLGERAISELKYMNHIPYLKLGGSHLL